MISVDVMVIFTVIRLVLFALAYGINHIANRAMGEA